MDNRPQGRKKNITGTGKPINKRGSGLGTGPVGQSGTPKRPTGAFKVSGPKPSVTTPITNTSTSQGSGTVRAGGGGGLLKLIIAAVILLGGGGAGLGAILGGGNDLSDISQPQSGYVDVYTPSQSQTQTQDPVTPTTPSVGGFDFSSLLGGSVGNVSTGWDSSTGSNADKLDNSVDPKAREKYTKLVGNGGDNVTIMVYMCGADLESKSGMGTSDLVEMTKASLNDKINLIVFTGGAKQWKNKVVSANQNQIYKIEQGGLRCLNDNAGNSAMTDPKNLSSFITYCAKNFPASRYELIFWDHGGGSISGYGYDEKNPRSGSMTLQGINTALKAGTEGADIKFDFIGFDACLMATLENALTLTPYADYLVASEETEPGVGWYYTDWLTELAKNTSMPTVKVGQNIVDDFVEECGRKCNGQKTTLSVTDLAELEATVPEKFSEFATGLSELLSNSEFKTVSDARANTREFATSSKIDQIDLVNLLNNLGNEESRALADTLLKAVKYNRTSSNMTNAYGLSIYFPYQKASNVDNAVAAYNAIGIDSEYARCIQQFASMEVSGQHVSGGAASPFGALSGATSGGSMASSDMISSLLGSLLGGNVSGLSGFGGGASANFIGKSLDPDAAAAYIAENRLDPSQLQWVIAEEGYVMDLSEEQWSYVHDLQLNVFYDDGEGYIDLGLDNVFDFTSSGALLGEYDGTWLAINGQPVPYYYMDTVYDGDDYAITGRVPVLLNGDRAELILVFDTENPYGYIAGVRMVYINDETATVAKSIDVLTEGDVIEFVCDYYSYEGDYLDSYLIGEEWVYDGNVEISNVYIDAENASACYLFTDIYNQQYWTPVMP